MIGPVEVNKKDLETIIWGILYYFRILFLVIQKPSKINLSD